VGVLERRLGIVGRLFHRERKNVEFLALQFLDEVLTSSGLISDIWWHYDDSESL
jgi:hypothetical protein